MKTSTCEERADMGAQVRQEWHGQHRAPDVLFVDSTLYRLTARERAVLKAAGFAYCGRRRGWWRSL